MQIWIRDVQIRTSLATIMEFQRGVVHIDESKRNQLDWRPKNRLPFTSIYIS